MKLSLFTDNIDEYLKKDGVVNYENVNIIQFLFVLVHVTALVTYGKSVSCVFKDTSTHGT